MIFCKFSFFFSFFFYFKIDFFFNTKKGTRVSFFATLFYKQDSRCTLHERRASVIGTGSTSSLRVYQKPSFFMHLEAELLLLNRFLLFGKEFVKIENIFYQNSWIDMKIIIIIIFLLFIFPLKLSCYNICLFNFPYLNYQFSRY